MIHGVVILAPARNMLYCVICTVYEVYIIRMKVIVYQKKNAILMIDLEFDENVKLGTKNKYLTMNRRM